MLTYFDDKIIILGNETQEKYTKKEIISNIINKQGGRIIPFINIYVFEDNEQYFIRSYLFAKFEIYHTFILDNGLNIAFVVEKGYKERYD